MMRRGLIGMILLVVMGVGREAEGIIYLPENSLESLLVRCPVVVTAKVTSVDEGQDRATMQIEKTLKGDVKGDATVKGVMRRITVKEKKARFAAGDHVMLFLGQDPSTKAMSVVASQQLANEKEVKAMEGCVVEVMPMAGVLADLGNARKEVDVVAVKAAVGKLVASENEFTKILVGRLMGTSLAARVKPEGCEALVLAGLTSTRKELRKGALVWVGKFKVMPEEVRKAMEKVRKEDG
ncbi:MAG: hypothetical protein FWD53_07280 [Phycisphaerales bacterium]|nr:hypothetical protein [Phycisphaerales bacterium]